MPFVTVEGRRLEYELIARTGDADAPTLILLHEGLGSLAELRADAGGGMHPVEATKPIDPSRGARVEPGRVQLGLTTSEIADVAERLATLLDDVDRGALAVF